MGAIALTWTPGVTWTSPAPERGLADFPSTTLQAHEHHRPSMPCLQGAGAVSTFWRRVFLREVEAGER